MVIRRRLQGAVGWSSESQQAILQEVIRRLECGRLVSRLQPCPEPLLPPTSLRWLLKYHTELGLLPMLMHLEPQ